MLGLRVMVRVKVRVNVRVRVKVRVRLGLWWWSPERGGVGGHDLCNDAVEVDVRWPLHVQVSPADVVYRLVVHHEAAVWVLQCAVGGQDGVVRFYHRRRKLGTQGKNVRFGSKVGQIGTEWDKSWTFKVIFQYIWPREPIWTSLWSYYDINNAR